MQGICIHTKKTTLKELNMFKKNVLPMYALSKAINIQKPL